MGKKATITFDTEEKVDPVMSVRELLKDSRPKVEQLSDEEKSIRETESEEESRLRGALEAATAARISAENDVQALQKISKKAAGSFLTVGGMEARADEALQSSCRSFFPLADLLLREATENERRARLLLSSACTAHTGRRNRLVVIREREREKERAADKERKLQEQKAERIRAMKAFLESQGSAGGRI